jgi:hypothetical protein
MQFIVTASEDLAPVARQFLHSLSLRSGHDGAFWSLKQYQDNEVQLNSKQPVIFLGENEISACYVDMLPEHFRAYGTRCLFAGSKAVLLAEPLKDVSPADIRNLRRVVHGESGPESVDDNGFDWGWGFLGGRAVAGAAGVVGAAIGLGVFLGAFAIPIAASAVTWAACDGSKARTEYRQLQFQYVSQRFLKEDFDAFVSGIEALR